MSVPLPIFHFCRPIFKSIAGIFFFWLLAQNVAAQETQSSDSVFFLANKKGLLGKIGKSLSVNNPDPIESTNGAIKNESAFSPYKGKIIRHILVEKLNFNTSVNDTLLKRRNFFNDLGNALHTSTAQKVIMNNLFFSEGDSLYPALLADNERFIRELTYLQDAKISVLPTVLPGDSVDILVICKDVFPIGGSVDAGSVSNISFEVNDDNLSGTGNRLQLHNYFDVDRSPNYGFGIEYLKRNLKGTFINLAAGLQTQGIAFNSGRREERSLYLRGDLPLVSPYHSWTGAFELATHATTNAFLTDSLYQSDFRYNYRILDGWIGHNIGARSQLLKNLRSRFRKIVSIRGIHKRFLTIPDVYKTNYRADYSDLSGVLGSFTLFEQDYYHTNFLYGFGRNEDLPEGFNITVTGGWSLRSNLSRPYMGFEYQRNYFTRKKEYINYTIRLGGYHYQGQVEDISFLTSLEFFTKLKKLKGKNWYSRQFISGSITQLAKTRLNETLHLSSDFGIPQLDNTNVQSSTRISLNVESVFYNTWKFVGFSFAPFVFSNATYLKKLGSNVSKGDIYTALGGGIRTRNENLVFGTIELKGLYYPRISGNLSKWNVTLNTDLRFKYVSQLVKRPDFVIVN